MPPTLRQYGKKTRKPKVAPLFEKDPTNPSRPKSSGAALRDADVNKLTEKLSAVDLSVDISKNVKSPKKKMVARMPLRRSPRKAKAKPRAEPTALEGEEEAPLETPAQPEAVVEMESQLEEAASQPMSEKTVPDEPKPKGTKKKGRPRKNSQAADTVHREEEDPASLSQEVATTLIKESKPRKSNDKPGKSKSRSKPAKCERDTPAERESSSLSQPPSATTALRELGWSDLCPAESTITKIAEASFAEVYRVRNPLGTSIIKVIRLSSPIKPQTRAQVKAELVDEEPHDPTSASSELLISQWLASIPGFVVYKEQFLVVGKGTPGLLSTHQAFHRKLKRQDPGRLQFYPSPSRYLDDTKFLVVELGDAGMALEDLEITHIDMVWDIFFLLAIALARAEELAGFEHRDLHEGNLCVRRVRDSVPQAERAKGAGSRKFGFSGLDITVLDYGLSRADDPDAPIPDTTVEEEELVAQQLGGGERVPSTVAFSDLDNDLSLFTSTHAAQCAVYRRMRSHLLRGTRCHLPPSHPSYETAHPSTAATGEPLDWAVYAPYTNVLWLAYIYSFLTSPKHFKGSDKESLREFKKETAEMWLHLNPDAPDEVESFSCAGDVVMFAVEVGWIKQGQLVDGGGGGGHNSVVINFPAGGIVGNDGAGEEEEGEREEGGGDAEMAKGMKKLALETILKEDEDQESEPDEASDEEGEAKEKSSKAPPGRRGRSRRERT
ncbi:hypothetical protein MKZ38_002970 [Zalerion maritima]|uniref:non-specific serine/threonine protein kinase n=1 Tax=Zalerion maritima TaxID=339359 RepID=A0AAD5RPL5_9PEZI|nr:hypothetical protein MKZ38_002970 [Zalerion maritima]